MRPRRSGVALLAGMLVAVGGGGVAAAGAADVCLEIAPGALSAEEWSALDEPVAAAIGSRTALFPDPETSAGDVRIDVHSGHDGIPRGEGSCLLEGYEWTARFGRDFLTAGAERMLAEAPTTPGIGSEVSIEWYPDESRLRTTLVFAGPLDFPNGTCWIDDTLSVDAAPGTVVASGVEGVKTSPFAESACDRFFEHLPEGGAGEQAVTLLPPTVVLTDGSELRFVAEDVLVEEDAVSVSGRFARD